MDTQNVIDIFPTLPQPNLQLLSRLSEKAINDIFDDDSLNFLTMIPENSNAFIYIEKKQTERIIKNRHQTCKEAHKNSERCEKIQWIKIINRYRIENNRCTKKPIKNANIRLGWRSKNFFLVKSHFTFGLRKVPTGHIDFIQTSSAPMLVFTPKECVEKIIFHQTSERILPLTDERSFQCFQLKPFKRYLVHAHQSYIIVTVQKTLFALTRMNASIYNRLKKNLNIKNVRSITEHRFIEPTRRNNKPPQPTYTILPTKWDAPSSSSSTVTSNEEMDCSEPVTQYIDNSTTAQWNVSQQQDFFTEPCYFVEPQYFTELLYVQPSDSYTLPVELQSENLDAQVVNISEFQEQQSHTQADKVLNTSQEEQQQFQTLLVDDISEEQQSEMNKDLNISKEQQSQANKAFNTEVQQSLCPNEVDNFLTEFFKDDTLMPYLSEDI